MTLLKLAFITIAFSGNALSAEWTKEQKECVFKNVTAFGASVTMATPTLIPPYPGLVVAAEAYGAVKGSKEFSNLKFKSPLKKYRMQGYGKSPVSYLVKNYLGVGSRDHITFSGIYFQKSRKDLGSSQIKSLLSGENRKLFESSSILVGVDAFYWDANQGNCGTSSGAEAAIVQLVEEAKASGKVLVLGNAPFENPANVRINSDRNRDPLGMWWEADDWECAQSINETLEEYCTYKNNCYVVDLKKATDDVNCGKKLKLKDGTEFSLFEIRPDGVHMSDKGSRYIAELAEIEMDKHPPKCGNVIAPAISPTYDADSGEVHSTTARED